MQESSKGSAQIVFGGADEKQRQYIESLEERVRLYEQSEFELRLRVRARLVTRGWTNPDVDGLLAEEAGDERGL